MLYYTCNIYFRMNLYIIYRSEMYVVLSKIFCYYICFIYFGDLQLLCDFQFTIIISERFVNSIKIYIQFIF